MNPIKRLSTHSGRLERYVGKEVLEMMSGQMKQWYGPPIAVADVPGNIWMCPGGDFRGVIRAGQYMNAVDLAIERLKRAWKVASRRAMIQQNAGFASLSDIISEATSGGKRRQYDYVKLGGTTTGTGYIQNFWFRAQWPPAGAAPAAAAAGTVPDDSSTGAFPFTNPAAGDTQHLVSAFTNGLNSSVLMLYDYLFGVSKTMNSTNNESVTGVPTRYTSQTATDADYIGGNFLFIQVGAVAIPSTAHNWTACTYTDQGGAASTLPDVAGQSASGAGIYQNDIPLFYAPLASGDVGIKALTNMHCDALVATGNIYFIIGHPLATFLSPTANQMTIYDGINIPLNLPRIMDDAALSFLDFSPTGGSGNFTGSLITVSG